MPSSRRTGGEQLYCPEWTPPFEFTHHSPGGRWWHRDLRGRLGAQVVEGISPWLPFFDFEIMPVVGIEEAVPIFMKTNAWRDSVS